MSLHSAATSIASSLGSRSSYTGSNASRSSRKSNKSRRSRKRLSSKEGGPHEEEYLVTTLKNSIPSKKFIDQDIGQLLRILVFFGHLEEAKKLQKNLEVYITTVDSALVPLLTSEREINTPVGQQHPPFPTHLVDASSQWKLNILTSTTTTNSSASTSTFTH
jgi:hypothetical protein